MSWLVRLLDFLFEGLMPRQKREGIEMSVIVRLTRFHELNARFRHLDQPSCSDECVMDDLRLLPDVVYCHDLNTHFAETP